MTDNEQRDPDVEWILRVFAKHGVEYLIVGGVAAQLHGAARPTHDLDVVARTGHENLECVASALVELSAFLRVSGLTDEEARALPMPVTAESLATLEISTWRTDAGDIDILASLRNEQGQRQAFDDLVRLCCIRGSGVAPGRMVEMNRRRVVPPADRTAFSGYRFPPDVILLAVRWYLRYGLSYRDVEELLAERGIDVDHVTIYRWVQRFTPLLIEAAKPCRHAVGDRWFVDETYVKASGKWRYVYRAVDQHGQVIDVYVSKRRNIPAARRFFTKALAVHGEPVEVVTDLAQALETVIEEQIPDAFHNTEQYQNNRVECDHGRLKSRLRPMRGLKTDLGASVAVRGHGFVQNLRRGHYELGVEACHQHLRIAAAFDELATTM